MGKVHGSLARAGKVKTQTPKVGKMNKKKNPRGRAANRRKWNSRIPMHICKVGYLKKLSHNQQNPGKRG